jgi:hypothetical protein
MTNVEKLKKLTNMFTTGCDVKDAQRMVNFEQAVKDKNVRKVAFFASQYAKVMGFDEHDRRHNYAWDLAEEAFK